jgi:hypothetical protein
LGWKYFFAIRTFINNALPEDSIAFKKLNSPVGVFIRRACTVAILHPQEHDAINYLSPQLFFKSGATVVQLFRKVEEELGEEIVCISKT